MQKSPDFQLVAVDAPMLVFQSFYGIPDDVFDGAGRSVNAVLGFTLRLLDLLQKRVHAADARIVICWDESLGSGFRHRLYPPYKANRPIADEEFIYQLRRCTEVADSLGLAQCASQEFEADDLIAALVHRQHEAGQPALVVTQDKDLAQIVMPGDTLWAFPKGEPLSHAALLEHWQIPLTSIADYLALCGDSVDNIPGAKGIGAVTARTLLQHFSSLEALYDNLMQVSTLPVRGAAALQTKLAAQRDEVFLFRQLTRLRHDALTDSQWLQLICSAAQPDRLERVLTECNLWRRVQKKASAYFA